MKEGKHPKTSRVVDWLSKSWPGLLLVLYAFSLRIISLPQRAIPFSFDHGKDFLAILHLVETSSIKLIGPWTSIPGLYFGPAWYYLLAPFYAFSKFDPLASVFPLILLLLIQVWLVYRFFGLSTAILVACTPIWFTISKSAWNPFPMTLITWIVLIAMTRIDLVKKVSWQWALVMGLAMSFGFHFSAAFAVFYLPILIALSLLRKWRYTKKSLLAIAAGFMLPFLPQLLFELRHSFVQSKAVVAYFTQLGSHDSSYSSLSQIILSIALEIRLATAPDLIWGWGSGVFSLLILATCLFILITKWKRDPYLKLLVTLTVVFTAISVVGLSLIHYNVWYVLGLLPVWTLLVGYLISELPRAARYFILIVVLLAPMLHIYRLYTQELPQLLNSRQFLPIKEKAVDEAYRLALDKPFASYHYVPDIYDFSYQSLYFRRGLLGDRLPTDFAYEPNVPEYYLGKSELIEKLSRRQIDQLKGNQAPELIFFIVEKPFETRFLEEWWGRQVYGEILAQYQLSPELTLFAASPRVKVEVEEQVGLNEY